MMCFLLVGSPCQSWEMQMIEWPSMMHGSSLDNLDTSLSTVLLLGMVSLDQRKIARVTRRMRTTASTVSQCLDRVRCESATRRPNPLGTFNDRLTEIKLPEPTASAVVPRSALSPTSAKQPSHKARQAGFHPIDTVRLPGWPRRESVPAQAAVEQVGELDPLAAPCAEGNR